MSTTEEDSISLEPLGGSVRHEGVVRELNPYESKDSYLAVNMPAHRKWLIVFALASMGFVVSLGSSATAPGVTEAIDEFKIHSAVLGSLIVSVYNFGLAIGPLIMAPMSEIFGRLMPYHITNVLFTIFTIGCATSPNLAALIIFRMLAGATASAVMTIGGATVADMFVQEQRGRAMAVYTFGQLLGPAVGPVMGGYLTQAKGWRWVFWVVSMAGAVGAVVFLMIVRETYPPVLLQRELKRLQRTSLTEVTSGAGVQVPGTDTATPVQGHDVHLRGRGAVTTTPAASTATVSTTAGADTACAAERPPQANWQRRVSLAIRRPLVLLFRSPIVFLFSVFIAVVYSYQFVLFVTIPDLFRETYHFSTGQVGLAYLGIAAGFLIGNATFGIMSDRFLLTQKARGKAPKPEHRLPLMFPGALCIPACLFIYGWTAYYRVHWIAPIAATSLLGIGLNISIMTIQVYLVDVYTLHAASALAAATIFRSLFGCFLPLAAPPLYKALGIGWGNSVLGFIALAMTSVPLIFVRYGEAIRTSSRYQLSL